MWVRDVMTRQPVTVHEDTGIKTAVRMLDQHSITAMPVVDSSGRLVGVLSEADVVRDVVHPDVRSSLRLQDDWPVAQPRVVAEVMTRHPVTVHADTDLAHAVDIMTSTTVKSLPVVDDHGHVVGVVSRADVVHSVARSDADVERAVESMFEFLGVDWVVDVTDGVAAVEGPVDAKEQALAKTAVGTVEGVLDVTFR
jgi:CBS-domain-containing membrane protein